MKYEYIVIHNDGNVETLQNRLDYYGEKGFKLVGISNHEVILMRKVEFKEDDDYDYREDI